MQLEQTIRKYDTYKDSGIEWIGEIPQAWNLEPLKMHSKIYGRIGFRGYTQEDLVDEGEGAITLSPTNIIDNTLTLEKCQYLSWNKYYESPEIMVDNGDILFVKTASVGKCAIYTSNELATINPQFVVFKNVTCNSKYLFYMLLSEVIQTPITLSNLGSVVGTIKQSELASYKIPIPSINEQQYIAEYLDKKCSSIDEVIETEKSVIEKLKEYKQSIITEAVTKGLDKSIPLKDSGIEWIGKIPQHWEVRKIKNSSVIISKGTTPTTMGYEIIDNGNIRFIKAENIQNNELVNEPYSSIDEQTNEALKRSQLEINDILFVIAGATIGKVAIINEDFLPANTNQAVSFIRLKQNENHKFIWYFLQSYYVKEKLNILAVQSAQPNLSMEDLGNFYFAYPLAKEQQQIAKYLDKKCTEIDKAIVDKEQVIEKFTEYKKSLIYECVTGKRKVAL